MTRQIVCYLGAFMLLGSPALAQFNSGSDGSDGAFKAWADTEIDLSLAATASWDTPSPVPGHGVYDPQMWAVVFKYTTIGVPSGVTVTFSNHPSGAPVVWLATADVTIDGTVDLSASDGSSESSFAEAGPGGFGGGREGFYGSPGLLSSAGFGPGGAARGAANNGYGGGYGTVGGGGGGGPTYGNPSILPLIGGSGASGGSYGSAGADGGAGGGALIIASSGAITVSGTIRANGGQGEPTWGAGGSGGAIRLVANTVSGSGSLTAIGGAGYYSGGKGRIRIEDYDLSFTGSADPTPSFDVPCPVFPASDAPKLTATFVDGVAVPSDPLAGILTTDVDIDNAQEVTINIVAENIPIPVDPNDAVTVEVRIVPSRGGVITVTSTPLTGTFESSTAEAYATFPPGRCEVQLRANWTP